MNCAIASNVTTYHLELKDWPESKQQEAKKSLDELVNSNRCYDYSGHPIDESRQKPDCHKFVWFKDNAKLVEKKSKIGKRLSPSHVKMVVGYEAGETEKVELETYRLSGSKLTKISDNSYVIDPSAQLKTDIAKWSFK